VAAVVVVVAESPRRRQLRTAQSRRGGQLALWLAARSLVVPCGVSWPCEHYCLIIRFLFLAYFMFPRFCLGEHSWMDLAGVFSWMSFFGVGAYGRHSSIDTACYYVWGGNLLYLLAPPPSGKWVMS
jgi:hypothetical protein